MSETDERIEFRGHCRSIVHYLRKIRALLIWMLLLGVVTVGSTAWLVLWIYGII